MIGNGLALSQSVDFSNFSTQLSLESQIGQLRHLVDLLLRLTVDITFRGPSFSVSAWVHTVCVECTTSRQLSGMCA